MALQPRPVAPRPVGCDRFFWGSRRVEGDVHNIHEVTRGFHSEGFAGMGSDLVHVLVHPISDTSLQLV